MLARLERNECGQVQIRIQTPEEKKVEQMEKHRGAAVHWFQNGHPMKTMIERHDEMLGVGEKNSSQILQRMVLEQTTRNSGHLETEETQT